MTPIRCNRCGSSNLRADRALAGRIICNDCGTPFSKSRPWGKSRSNKAMNSSVKNMLLFIIFIIIIGLIIF